MKLLPKRFGAKLAGIYLAIFISVFTLTAVFVSRVLEHRTLALLQNSLLTQSNLLSSLLTPAFVQTADREAAQNLVSRWMQKNNARATVVNREGLVLADSERSWNELVRMDNHRNRPEIKQALAGDVGTSVRYSQTLKTKMLYVAVPIGDPKAVGALRLALPLDQVETVLSSVRQPIVIGSVAGVLFVLGAGLFLSRRVGERVSSIVRTVERFAKGELAGKVTTEADDELKQLADAINRMAETLKARIAEIEAEKTILSSILENIEEGIVAVNRQKRILVLNPGAEAILGVSKASVVGKTLLEAVQNNRWDELTDRALDNRSVETEEIELAHGTNRTIKLSVAGLPASGRADGVGAVLVLYDVSEIRKLEGIRRDFVANVSHELKTPLTSLRGLVETLLGGAWRDEKSSERFLKMIEEDAVRLGRLIDDLLELSKIESGVKPLQPALLSLDREIPEILKGFEERLKKESIELEHRMDAEPGVKVMADRDQFRQVLINLIDNAIKFNKAGGKISIRTSNLNSQQVGISVEDTGLGIPKDAIPRIFERFFRVDKARSREKGGTGLGLSIVKHIVEAHGGSVSCSSQVGRGSVFSFTLPRALPR